MATFVDVLEKQENMDEMLVHSDGRRRIPVIVENGKATVGYNGGS